MYKQFKKNLDHVETETTTAITRGLTNLSVNDLEYQDPEVVTVVDRCWEQVEHQCQTYTPQGAHHSDGEVDLGWKTVRIFVSSTFSDFYCEREVLVKKVFPELREWCQERKLYLIECDLRWGVPKHSTSMETVCTCMEELDRCMEETSGQPFFINMMGERYGWIPAEFEVDEDVKKKYQWISNTSITFMELLHGALRCHNPNAVFFLRDSAVLKDIPANHIPRYKDKELLCRQQLKALKRKIREKFPASQVIDYSCQVDGTFTIHEKEIMKLVGLETFAEQVLQFFKSAIEKQYPDRGNIKSLTYLEEEAALQRSFMEQKSAAMIGREKEVDLLLSYAQGKTIQLPQGEVKEPFSRDIKFWTSDLKGSEILCVQGPAGLGKTTLLAGVTHKALQQGSSVFYHFCGSTGSSHNAELLLLRLLGYLKNPSKEEEEVMSKNSIETLREDLKGTLLELQETGSDKPILLVLDAVDQLSTCETVNHLSWLPPVFPGKIHCLVSTADHSPTVARIQEHRYLSLVLSPLDKKTAQSILETYLWKYGKKLDKDQMSILTSSSCIENPLWLYLIAEELRIYGEFRSLTKKLQSLSTSLESLLTEVIERLVYEDDTQCMEKTLCLMVCSYGILTAVDMQRMLGNIQTKEPVAPLHWATIRRNLRAYLRFAGYNEQLVFVHNAIRKAIMKKFLKYRGSDLPHHKTLADYLEFWSEDKKYKAQALPYHLQLGHLNGRLVHFIREDPEAANIPDFRRSHYLKSCRCQNLADPVIHKTNPVLICQFCKMNRAKFHPRPFHSNQDMCMVCGGRVSQHKAFSHDAYVCIFHSPQHGVMARHCFVCGKIVNLDNKGIGGINGKLCQHCGFGNEGKRCAFLKVK